MKIFVCCNWARKFAGRIIDYWQDAGHDVVYRLGYDPKIHEWADVCFVDVCDNNAKVASQNCFPGSRLVIRAIDIEVWAGIYKGVTWENVDALVFGARHIEKVVRDGITLPDNVAVSHVPFGLDVDKWTFRERDGSGRDVAFVAHRWAAKGLPLLLQVMAKLGPGWRLHLLGTWSKEGWLQCYWDQQVERLGLDVTVTERVESVDEWLEPMEFLISCSAKEAFGYAIAESAAKGIKPLVHAFYGARDIWPIDWLWDTIDECLKRIDPVKWHYESASYRTIIERAYSLDRMMAGLNAACEIG